MNYNCNKVCKHTAYCALNADDTGKCCNSDAELDAVFGRESESLIFGMTSKEIAAKQGNPGKDLKK